MEATSPASARRVFPAGERPGGLVELCAAEHEGAEQPAQLLFAAVGGGVADVLPHAGGVVDRVVLLGEVADLEPVAGHQLPGVGGLGAGEDPQQGGLARAVEPEHHHPRSPVDGQIDAGEHLQ